MVSLKGSLNHVETYVRHDRRHFCEFLINSVLFVLKLRKQRYVPRELSISSLIFFSPLARFILSYCVMIKSCSARCCRFALSLNIFFLFLPLIIENGVQVSFTECLPDLVLVTCIKVKLSDGHYLFVSKSSLWRNIV